MEAWLHSSIQWLLITLALPKVGLSAIFIVSLVSATLLPLGSEPAVFAFVRVAPDMFWPAVLIATLGNTIGGAISFAMGAGAEKAYESWRRAHDTPFGADNDQFSTDGRDQGSSSAVWPRPALDARSAGPASSVRQLSDTGLDYSTALEQAPGTQAQNASSNDKHPGHRVGGRWHTHVHYWTNRLGPMALLFSWLPLVGDPLCAVAGWLRLAFWPSVFYMAIGKFVRYTVMTAALMWVFPNL